MRRIKPKKSKNEVMLFRLDEQLRNQLVMAQYVADTTMSHIVREAIREKIKRMAEQYPELNAA